MQLLAIVTAALKLWLVLQHCCYCTSVAVNHDEQTRFNTSTNAFFGCWYFTVMLLLIPFASFCVLAVTVAATSDNRMMLLLHANTAAVVPAAIVHLLTLLPIRM